jgi:uncharacterized membrane protein
MEETRPRPTAVEVRKKYAISSSVVTVFLLWFIRDGWFNGDPKMQEHLMFNRTGSVLLGFVLAFCLMMLASAALAVRRERRHQNPPAER